MEFTLSAKITILLIPLLCYLVETKIKKETRGFWRKIFFPTASFVVVCLSVFLLYRDDRESDLAKADASNWKAEWRKSQAELKSKMNQVGGLAGNSEMAEKFIKEARENNAAYAKGSTETASESFYASKDKRRAFRQDAAKVNDNAVLRFRVRNQPLLDLALEKIEAWVASVNKRGAQIEMSPQAQWKQVVGSENGGAAIELRFSKGGVAMFQVYPAHFENGNSLRGLHVQFVYNPAKGQGYEIWILDANAESYYLGNPRESVLSFPSRQGNMMNPNEDILFKEALSRSLDEVMGFLIDDAASAP